MSGVSPDSISYGVLHLIHLDAVWFINSTAECETSVLYSECDVLPYSAQINVAVCRTFDICLPTPRDSLPWQQQT
jgi:hypothetical protein